MKYATTLEEVLALRSEVAILRKALEEEREYWAGKVASAMLRNLPSDDSQDRVDRISRVLDVLIRPGHT